MFRKNFPSSLSDNFNCLNRYFYKTNWKYYDTFHFIFLKLCFIFVQNFVKNMQCNVKKINYISLRKQFICKINYLIINTLYYIFYVNIVHLNSYISIQHHYVIHYAISICIHGLQLKRQM